MDVQRLLQSSSVWLGIFIIAVAVLYVITGTAMQGAISGLILVGFLYLVYNVIFSS